MVLDYVILFILICVFIILIWILKHSNSNNKGLLHLSEFENKIGSLIHLFVMSFLAIEMS